MNLRFQNQIPHEASRLEEEEISFHVNENKTVLK
jgi:hypothetical protein